MILENGNLDKSESLSEIEEVPSNEHEDSDEMIDQQWNKLSFNEKL